ncbi:cysteine proteinase [Sistotremastrum suecicum HHB10207 ss-3]|uniref:Cysteine proteinase n=1 Tax=Sistotremastrum suecicum HHB10207 ss-3 TaxID=1314776 RepID=A0A166IDH3_9AGAM|nr:cysteine proteinase [Sistotremastrum suecicum HHB10207 ss-3]
MFNALTSTFLRKTIPTQPTEPGRPTPLPQNSLLRYPGQQLPQQQHLDKAGLLVTQELSKAIDRCKAKVRRIVKDCKRRNCRFRDIEFDLEEDRERCLHGLMTQENERFSPAGVSRIHQIFEDPKFFIGRPESTDIVQGALGDCWFLSALGTVATVPGLIEKMCVDRDEKAGVYGFIFWRDCEWVDVIIDDQLFVSVPHYEELSYKEKTLYHQDKEKYNLAARKGGKTLFFARSRQENETWVPLIEKAFAKLHGDFASMDGGHCDEAAEDLTGGVSTVFHTNACGISMDIMDPNEFWESEMLRANYDRAFACYLYSMPGVDETISVQTQFYLWIISGHSYSVIKATEVKNRRFLKIRNPWSRAEWTGRWSDGSKEWSGEWLEALDALDHQFGDDGVFIMEYEDFLNTWTVIVRTRIFDSSWCMSSHWLNCKPRSFPCAWDYGDISFTFTLPEPTFAVVVLGQLDDRYFRDISGTSAWTFDFVIYKKGDTEIYHSSAHSVFWKRTQHLEGEFESGDYVVHVGFQTFLLPHLFV